MENQGEVGGGGTLLYVYCFFEGSASLEPVMGIDGAGPTRVISHRDVCALVSLVPLEEYGGDALARRAEDAGWLTPRAKRHGEIVEAVMRRHTVVPVRFGTLFASEERLLEALRRAYSELASALALVREKEEWGLKVYAVRGAGSAGGPSERVRALNRRLASASAGEAYLLRKQIERLVREERDGRVDTLSSQLFREASARTVRARRNPTLGRRATGLRDAMILNAAFLVRRSEVGAFRAEVDKLAERYATEELMVVLSGPWPPYNFSPDLERKMVREGPSDNER